MGSRVVDADLELFGIPCRLTKGRQPWLGLVAIKHFDVVVFYARKRLKSRAATRATFAMSVAEACRELIEECMIDGWGEANQEFVTTLTGARTLRSVLPDLSYASSSPAAA